MKLCFIWIKNYKGFNNLSLNFSDDINFTYDPKSNTLSNEVNENFIPELFEKKISYITAIVGKNGAGKSNCLEIICTILQGSIHQFNTEFISVLEHDKELIVSYKLINDPNILFEHAINNDKKKTRGFNTIFFSNVNDGRYFEFSKEVIKATASDGYGYRSRMRSFGLEYLDNNSNLLSSQLSLIIKHRKSLQEEINIEIPEYIHFEFISAIPFNTTQKNLYEFMRIFRKRITDITNAESKLICLVKYNFLITIIQTMIRLNCNRESISLDFEEKEPTDSFLNKKIKSLMSVIHMHNDFTSKPIKEKITEILNFRLEELDYIENNIKKTKITISENSLNRNTSFKIKLTQYNHDVIDRLCNILNNTRHVKISWVGISSGTMAYINLLSVLFDKLKGTRNDTLICIDEGDLYLHPSWQIKFLRNLNKMLPNFTNANIQLVLTSHSPFLLTDLPRDNVIILDDKKVIDKNLLPLKTFGSNIYDLYNNAFFLDNKFGSIAQEHINRLIFKIKNKDYHENDIENMSKLINIIGDKLLSNALRGLLQND